MGTDFEKKTRDVGGAPHGSVTQIWGKQGSGGGVQKEKLCWASHGRPTLAVLSVLTDQNRPARSNVQKRGTSCEKNNNGTALRSKQMLLKSRGRGDVRNGVRQ